MGGVQQLVVEADIAVVHADVRQRETRRCSLRIGGPSKALQQVGEVELLGAEPHDVQLRVLQGELIQDRCAPEQ